MQYMYTNMSSFRFRLSFIGIFSGLSIRNSSRVSSRLFCSEATSNNGSSRGIDRKLILDSSLQFVPQYGWSVKALECGAKAVDFPGVAHGLFPSGGVELIEHFEFDCNARLIKYLEDVTTRDNEPLKGGRLVQSAVEERLQMLIPYIDTWPEALSIKAYPSNALGSLERASQMFDDIWYYAGDRSTDFNWYTKRGILAAVYCTTELYMIQDKSVNFQDTWDFLRRRFQDTRTFTECRQQAEGIVGGAYEFGSAAVTTVMNLIGFGSRNR